MPRKKTAKQLDAEIDAALEAEAQRELAAQQAARDARKKLGNPTPSSTYEGQLRYWDDFAARWGLAAAIERARTASAGGFLSRDFGETAEAFYARSPQQRANRDWLKRNG